MKWGEKRWKWRWNGVLSSLLCVGSVVQIALFEKGTFPKH